MRNCYTALCRSHQDKARALFWLIALASRTSRSKLPALIPRKQISFDHKQYSAILTSGLINKTDPDIQRAAAKFTIMHGTLHFPTSLNLPDINSHQEKFNKSWSMLLFRRNEFKKKTLCLSAEIKNPSVYCFVVIFRPSKLEYGERVFKYSSLYWKAVG